METQETRIMKCAPFFVERLKKRRRADSELREEVEEALFYDTWVDAEIVSGETRYKARVRKRALHDRVRAKDDEVRARFR